MNIHLTRLMITGDNVILRAIHKAHDEETVTVEDMGTDMDDKGEVDSANWIVEHKDKIVAGEISAAHCIAPCDEDDYLVIANSPKALFHELRSCLREFVGRASNAHVVAPKGHVYTARLITSEDGLTTMGSLSHIEEVKKFKDSNIIAMAPEEVRPFVKRMADVVVEVSEHDDADYVGTLAFDPR